MKFRRFFLLFCLLLSLQPLGASPSRAAQAGEPTHALLRVDPEGERQRTELVDLKLNVYEQLYTPAGELFLLAQADQPLRAELSRRSISYEILDPDAGDADYSLLYGDPQALTSAAAQTRILLREGNIAVARTTMEQLAGLIELGLDVAPLVPRPLVVAPPSAQPQPVARQSALTPKFLVQEMLGQANSLTLYNYVGGLSGEWAVQVNGSPYTFSSRYTYTETPIKKATAYTFDFFQSLGLDTWYDYYGFYGTEKRNVIAQQTGLAQPEKLFLLTAHLDSISFNSDPYLLAPGADDNASGSAALMQIAEILSQYQFDCTLRYALFTGEEQGLFGSWAYAYDIYSQDEDLQGVLNIDMLGYSTPGSAATIELHTRPSNAGDLAIASLFQQVIPAYGISLTPLILQDGKTFSDHSPFWNYGYPAILAIEDWHDHTPFYHSKEDQLESLNMGYYTEFAKAALAAFAHMGCLVEGRLTGTIRDADTNLPLPGAIVEAWQAGIKIRSAVTQANGTYQMYIDPGSYTIQVAAQDHLGEAHPATVVLDTQNTTLDASLEPCVFVGEVTASASPRMALIGETVNFSASAGRGDPPISFNWDFGDGQTASGENASHAFAAKGGYPVLLSANNACGVPYKVWTPVFVEVELYYLPLVSAAGSP